jgi:hypothetical protein
VGEAQVQQCEGSRHDGREKAIKDLNVTESAENEGKKLWYLRS